MNDYLESADIETSSENYASRFQGQTGAYFLEVQLEKVEKQLAVGRRPHPLAGLDGCLAPLGGQFDASAEDVDD